MRLKMIAIGLDMGTSACKGVVLDIHGTVQAQATTPLPAPQRGGAAWTQDPKSWWQALLQTLEALLAQCPDRRAVRALALDATSGTVLLSDAAGTPLAPALLYADTQASAEATRLRTLAPPDSPAQGASSSLAKVLWLHSRYPHAVHALHQADWLTGKLLGSFGTSDTNNALKLGYDLLSGTWPSWVTALIPARLLPVVYLPGTPLGTLHPLLAQRFGLSNAVSVVAGTTDSTAAFLATGASECGDAVTSLGSTLVLKILADRPVNAAKFGVYSHRLGQKWLVGGASNSGGAVLLAYFSRAELAALTPHLHPEQPTGLDYYPLLAPGERFPYADPAWPPRLSPRPAENYLFLQGLLEGLTQIEADGYRRLAALGAPPLKRIFTVGGGAVNAGWQALRAQALPVPLCLPRHTEAAYGAAGLALTAIQQGMQ